MMKGQDPKFAYLTPRAKLVLLGAIILVSSGFFVILGSVLGSWIYDVNIMEDPNALNDLDNSSTLSALKLMQIFQHVGMFIVPPLVLAYLVSQNPLKSLGLVKTANIQAYIYSGLIIFLALPLINWMVVINGHLALPEFMSSIEIWMKETEETAKRFTESFLIMSTTQDLAVNLLMVAIIPAIGEELLFRGLIQRLFINWTRSVHWGILIASILFSALHMQFFGFLPRMMLGILFGYLFLWSGTLWVPILCHFINNGSAVVFAYLEQRDLMWFNAENLGAENQDTMITIACTIAISGLLYLIYKKGKELQTIQV